MENRPTLNLGLHFCESIGFNSNVFCHHVGLRLVSDTRETHYYCPIHVGIGLMLKRHIIALNLKQAIYNFPQMY